MVPTTTPITVDNSAQARAMSNDVRIPAAIRTNRSRPAESVPKGCASDGAIRACAKSATRSSTPATHGTTPA